MSFFKNLKFIIKSVLFGTVLTGCALYGVLASIGLRLVNKIKYAQYTVARAFYHSFSTFLGVRIKMVNEKYLQNTPAIVISNHQSALDIYILGRLFQPGYTVTGKKSLKYVPFLGWFMYLSGTFFLDRSKGEKARKTLESSLVSLKKNRGALFVFPEGTRSGTDKLEMLPFKKGAFHLAKQAGIPVIPVVVSNTSTIFHAKSKNFNCGEITVEVMPPMSTTDLKTNDDVTAFTEKVREEMLTTLKRIGYLKTRSELRASNEPEEANDESEEEESVEVVTEESPLVKKSDTLTK